MIIVRWDDGEKIQQDTVRGDYWTIDASGALTVIRDNDPVRSYSGCGGWLTVYTEEEDGE
jgi:hypothetical protein